MKPNEAQYLVIYSRLRLALPLHHRRRRSLGCRRRSLSLSRAMEEKLYASFSLSSLGFGPSASSRNPLPPSPAPVEVLITEEELLLESSVEPIVIADGLTLHKGRVSTSDVFGLDNSDLVPGKYEGGLKLWEGSLDLVKRLHSEVHKGELVLRGKRVLELGCGHGLPGIFAGLEDASVIHFQDFNAEVLRNLTIPNVKVNLQKHLNQLKSLPISKSSTPISPSVRFFAGDWNEVHQLLPCCSDAGQQKATFAGSEGKLCDGYDVILMAETVYEPSSLCSLYALGKKCLQQPRGVIYMAGKKHYFGVGGGTRQFVNLVEEDGVMTPSLLAEVADGSSNVREVWKFLFK